MYSRLRRFILFLPIPLLVLVLILWVRSYLPEHFFVRSHEGKVLLVFVTGTRVHWDDSSRDQYQSTRAIIYLCNRYAAVKGKKPQKWMGIEWVETDDQDLPGLVMIPYWYLAIPLAGASVWWFLTRRARGLRASPGHCRQCGYDLRGSHDKCPECGMAVGGNRGNLAASTTVG